LLLDDLEVGTFSFLQGEVYARGGIFEDDAEVEYGFQRASGVSEIVHDSAGVGELEGSAGWWMFRLCGFL
jgi:hypothetical protein